MFAFGRRAMRSYVIFSIVGLAVAACGVRTALGDSLDAAAKWAENTTPLSWQRGNLHIDATTVEDHFGHAPYEAWSKRGENGLGYPGQALSTAGAGSSWVYDAAHHIAGGTYYNDDGGWDDQLAYAQPPPAKLPSRDLSSTTSAHGLHLGMSVADAAKDLGVSTKVAQRIDAHHSAISVERSCAGSHSCGPEAHKAGISGYFALVVFNDGRAVYIQLGVDGSFGG
jgi:hypothetical protein